MDESRHIGVAAIPTITNRQEIFFYNTLNNLQPKITSLSRKPSHLHVLILAKAMISEKQLNANRNNSLHSTGPKSAEGKRRSRVNPSATISLASSPS